MSQNSSDNTAVWKINSRGPLLCLGETWVNWGSSPDSPPEEGQLLQVEEVVRMYVGGRS